MKANPTLIVKNNTLFNQDVDVFNFVTPQSIINQDRQYLFNMSCEGFSGTNNVRIRSRLNGQSAYTTYNVAIADPNLANVVTALNTLGIGTFYSYRDSSDVPYITVYNSLREYTSLTLISLAGLTSDANYEAFISENTSGSMKIYANCLLIEDFAFPVSTSSPWNHPYGTLIKVVIVGGNNALNPVVYTISSPTGTLADGVVQPGETFEFSFVIDKPSTAFPYSVSIVDSV